MTFIPYTPPSGAVVTPPVHAETIVTVFYSDGDRDSRVAAGNINWSAEGDGPRVVAYRVVEEYTPPKVPREWWAVSRHLHESWNEAALFRLRCAEQHGHQHMGTPIIHVREVLPEPAAKSAPREVVAWAVVYPDVHAVYHDEADAQERQALYGGTVVKLTGVVP